MVGGYVRVFDGRLCHSLSHPFHIRESTLRRRGIRIRPITFDANALRLPGWLGLGLLLVFPGRSFYRPQLHHLLVLLEVLVRLNRLVAIPNFEFGLLVLFTGGMDELGGIRS